MRWIPDIMVVVGSSIFVFGVYLEFGVAYSLMVAGVCLGGLAINMARLINASDRQTKTRDT